MEYKQLLQGFEIKNVEARKNEVLLMFSRSLLQSTVSDSILLEIGQIMVPVNTVR